MPENEFFNFVLVHLKKLPKLEYLSLSGNPVQSTIREFRYFVIQELPRLKFLNWDVIAKEDRSFASDLSVSGTWDSKSNLIAQHASSPNLAPARPHGPLSETEKTERALKQGTYATSRLEELLAAEEAKLASSGPSSSSTGTRPARAATIDPMDDLDKILDMVAASKSPAASPAPSRSASAVNVSVTRRSSGSSHPITASSSTSSVLDELDALLGAATAPLTSSAAGNRGSYVDTLTGLLDEIDPKRASPAPAAPVPVAATASEPVYNGTPLDELEALLGEVEATTIFTPKTARNIATPEPSSKTTVVTVPVSTPTPPPPSRPTSMMVTEEDPLDALLADIEKEASISPSPSSDFVIRRTHTKPQSTIFDDLESDIFALESDHSARTGNNTPSPSSSQASPAPINLPIVTKVTTASTPLSSSGHDELDMLERDIAALSRPKTNGAASAASTPAAPAADPHAHVLQPEAQRPVAFTPRQTGGGLAALANFTSNMTSTQFDNLLDNFDSASAKALTTPVIVSTPPPAAVSNSPGSPSTSTRSLQRGPRPSAVVPMAPAKPLTNPWEIPAEDLTFEFLLGKGIWGETHEGTWRADRASGKSVPVALKRLNNKDFTPESVTAFRAETKDLLDLKHDNLIPLLGCSVRDSKVILWKGVNGAPLWGYIRNPSNVITPRSVLSWARQLASALAYLHSQHVIHGGVKTSNLILDREQQLLVKDFGYMDYKDEVPLVESDPRWLAPELIVARESGYNEKVDVYGFGMVIYEMMMRESPFISMKAAEIIDTLSYRIIRPETVPGIFPPLFIRLLTSCWSHDPAERPSMEKIVKILESSDDQILGDFADMHLEMPSANAPLTTRPTLTSAMSPRASEPPKPNPALIALAGPANGAPGSPKGSPRVSVRGPSASVGTMGDAANLAAPAPAPVRPALRVAKPTTLKMSMGEELSLEVEQERKLVALLSKLQEMLASGEPDSQARALQTLLEVVKDEKRINYVAKRSLLPRDLVELLRANSVDTINSWRFEYPRAFETIEAIAKTVSTLCSTDDMILAFLKHGMMVVLVELATRAADAIKIAAAQGIHELCLMPEGRTAFRKAAGITCIIAMLKASSEYIVAQGAWTLATALDDEYNQEDFIGAGGLETLQKLLHTTNAAIRLRVLDALSNLWNNEKAREICLTFGLKDKLMAMLGANSDLLNATAMRGLGKFARSADFKPSEIESLRILKAASEIISNPERFMRERLNAIQICDNLTAHDRLMLTNFRDMGGMSMMVKCVVDPEPSIRVAAIQILQRALADDKSRDAIISLGAVTPLISQLSTEHEEVRLRAMAAVDELIKFPRGRTAVIANAGVSRLISIIAYSNHSSEQVLALRLLDFFSDNPDHKEDVREGGGITAILENFGQFSTEAKMWACVNLCHLASTEKNRQAIVEQKGISPLLVTIQSLLRVAEHTHSQHSSHEAFIPEAQLLSLVNLVLSVLFNLSEIGDYRGTLRDADATQFACDMVSSHAETIVIHAVRALTGLASDPKNKVVIRTGASKKLKDLATTSSNSFLTQLANQVLNLIDASVQQ